MDQPIDDADRDVLRGRCPFCGGEFGADADVCPECGHGATEGLVVRPRRPGWVRVVAWVVLLMAACGLAAWIVNLLLGW